LKRLQDWKEELETKLKEDSDLKQHSHADVHDTDPHVLPLEELFNSNDETTTEIHKEEPLLPPSSLNNEQRRAYDIIDHHLQATLQGKNPPQLRMIIPGEGGTGKSHTIQTITNNFIRQNAKHWLVKGAYTGIAASIIDGSTLHVLTAMPIRGSRSAQTMKKLREFWKNKRYLIIDEMSMLSRDLFAKLSKILTIVLGTENDPSRNLSFGGLNVILAGDFHQFPPVVCRRSAPLFYPNNSRFDNSEEIIGREIYEQFTTVVRLTKQIRVEDPIWHDILQHVRYGNCKERHISLLRELIIDNSYSKWPPHTYDTPPWDSAVLVTPRHSVRHAWNSAMAKKHCVLNRRQLFISHAHDTIHGQSLSLAERFATLTKTRGKKDSGQERGGLAENVELAIGMPVMVTWNVHTELDIANGARGMSKLTSHSLTTTIH
jgi:hypothetical protein